MITFEELQKLMDDAEMPADVTVCDAEESRIEGGGDESSGGCSLEEDSQSLGSARFPLPRQIAPYAAVAV